jgi:chromosome segregation ATPase
VDYAIKIPPMNQPKYLQWNPTQVNKLENKTGMGYEQIIGKADEAHLQLKKSQQELESSNSKMEASQKNLAEIHKKEEQAIQDYKKHMQEIGLDEQKLKLVDPLFTALKKAKLPDQMLPIYLKRQELFNKAGISIDVIADIIDKSKVATLGDNGKHLLDMLGECGGLSEVINKQQAKKQLLEKDITDLEAKEKSKDKLEAEIKQLKVDKTALEDGISQVQKQQAECIAQYEKQKNEYERLDEIVMKLQISYQKFLEANSQIEHEIKEKRKFRDSLDNEIKDKNQQVSNLDEQMLKHEQLTKENAEMESKVKKEKTRWEVFESFLGMVQSTSIEDLQKNAKTLLGFITELEPGKHSPEFLKNYILNDLAGPELQILKCTTCQARFAVNKAEPPDSSYNGRESFGYCR